MTTYYAVHNDTGELMYLGEEEPDNDTYTGEGHFVFETEISITDLQTNFVWSTYQKSFVLKDQIDG